MRLIITRHGETEENRAGIMQGHLPGKLSPLGIEQAKKLATRLKSEKIDFIFSSDLARAADTAAEICVYHPQAILELTQELRERNLGDLTGKKKSGLDFDYAFREIKNGETLEKMYARAQDFLHSVLEQRHKDTVLFVGHHGINKALIAVITGKKYTDIPNMENMQNTSVSIFEIDENKNHKIHLLNDIEHLK